jgi:hypothetical protein
MPDFWSHIVAGDLIIDRLEDNTLKNIIKQNRTIYNLGCQGPDLFFYNDFWSWIKEKRGPKIGSLLHQKNIKPFFIESLSYLKSMYHHHNFPILLSYFSGFLAHYTVDKTAHPFVFAKQKSPNQHKLLEINLDTYLVEEIWGKKVYSLSPIEQIDLGNELPDIIIDYYKYILNKSHNHNLEIKLINDSYQDFKRIMKFFYSPYKIKKLSFKILNPLVPLNLDTLSYPTKINYKVLSEEDYLKFKELILDGVKEGLKLIEIMKGYLQDELENSALEVAFQGINFEGELIE